MYEMKLEEASGMGRVKGGWELLAYVCT